MKLLFSADWHIKLNTKNIPNTWAINRFKLLFEKIYELEKEVDLHVIGGDWFDRLPTLEELELYCDFVAGISIKTIYFSGNHEAAKKDTTFLTNLKALTTKINPLVTIVDDFETIENIDIIPYNKLKGYDFIDVDYFKGDILLTHVRGNIPPHVKSEIDLNLLKHWPQVLAGDLHSYENSQENILYPGSPITTSFHRKPVETGVIIFDTETMQHEWRTLNLPQLLRKTIQVGEILEENPPHHTIYEVEGDMSELAGMEENDLLDKKIVKRSTDTALILDSEMTIEDEINEYLAYILELPENTIEEVLKLYHDHTTKINLE